MHGFFKRYRWSILLAALFMLIQLPFLSQLSLLRGERDIMLTAWSLARTGRDLYGNILPLSFTGIDPYVPFAAPYVAALWWIIMPIKTVFTARLFFVLLSGLTLCLVYEVVRRMSQNNKNALLTAAVFSFSPGIFHLSRLSLEVGIAFPFLLGGMILHLARRRYAALAMYFVSFNSYFGFQPLIPILFFVIEYVLHLRREKRAGEFKKWAAVFMLASFVFFAVGFFTSSTIMNSRKGDLPLSLSAEWENKVVYRRNTSLAPTLVRSVFDNKITAVMMHMKSVFYGIFSTEYLFHTGDPSALYATTFSGQFFLVSFVFLIGGLLWLGREGKREDYYVIALIGIGMIPSLMNISYVSYSIRAILATVGFAYIIALGIKEAVRFIRPLSLSLRRGVVTVFLVLFGIELSYLGYNYYFRRVITMSEMYFETERTLPQYLISKNSPQFHVYVSNPRDMLFGYAFFDNSVRAEEIHRSMSAGAPYRLRDLTFSVCGKQMKEERSIIADTCYDEQTYQKKSEYFIKNNLPHIDYTNFSFRRAFFIFP